MSKSKKYKTFAELKETAISSSVSEDRIIDMIADLEDFEKKIRLSQRNMKISGAKINIG